MLRLLFTALTALFLLSACSHLTTAPDEPKEPAKDKETTEGNKETITPGSDRYKDKDDSAPTPEEEAKKDRVPQPEPKVEEPSRYGNHSPYEVNGKTYHVLPTAADYVAEGTASWYGRKFHGYRTSSGEKYDMYQYTAAHRTLPLPTFARVTNLDNNKSVIVRINDRGPFHEEREIDLSWAAAKALDITQSGTGRVKVETITGSSKQKDSVASSASRSDKNQSSGIHAAASSPPPPAELYLQVGAYRSSSSAQTLQSELLQELNNPVSIRPYDKNGERVYRLWVGPFTSESNRKETKQQLLDMGYDHTVNASP